MNQQTIVVTGCSTGIGEYCALALVKDGYRVIATARDDAAKAKLAQAGCLVVHLELADEQSVDDAFAEMVKLAQGPIHGLFNNAAYGQPGAVEDLTRSALRAQFETNLFGTHQLTRHFVALFRQQGFGRIVQNSSVLGLVAMPFRGAYNASKFALEGLTDTLRMEVYGSGIFVSLIEPGPITSKFRANALAALQRNVDMKQSFFASRYQDAIARLSKVGKAQPFTLGPEAVYDKLLHALRAKTPKNRYYVTFPTYLMGSLRRLLPSSWLDRMLRNSQ